MQLTVILAVGVDSSLIGTQPSVWQSAGYIIIPARSIKEAIDHFQVGDSIWFSLATPLRSKAEKS